MSLEDLQRAAYRSPSGITVEFDYEDIDSAVVKKTAAFENAIGNGTYVQSNGHTSGRFPMRCFFSGFGYDVNADLFLKALLEDGEGVLTHPIFNEVHVVPVDEIRRVDPLKSASKQVIYEVSFFETTGLQIGETTGGLDQVFDGIDNAAAMDFTEGVSLRDAVSKASFRNQVESAIKNIATKMQTASGSIQKAQERIEDTVDSINRGMDVLLGDPLSLARQVQVLMGEPRRSVELLSAKVSAYTNMAQDIFTGTVAENSRYTNDSVNRFHLHDLIASSSVLNLASLMADTNELKTKGDYVNAATSLTDLLDAYHTWRDANYDSIEQSEISAPQMDLGGSDISHFVSQVTSILFSRALHAKSEVREPLSAERTPLDLCFEYYGTVGNDMLDFFLTTNQLAGEELILIPRGREIARYV